MLRLLTMGMIFKIITNTSKIQVCMKKPTKISGVNYSITGVAHQPRNYDGLIRAAMK